jgi:hypothetical protein
MTKQILKVSDKLKSVNDSATIYYYDNGYMVEVGGRQPNDDWSSIKLMCRTLDEVQAILKEIDELPREG